MKNTVVTEILPIGNMFYTTNFLLIWNWYYFDKYVLESFLFEIVGLEVGWFMFVWANKTSDT